MDPLLTSAIEAALLAACADGKRTISCSLDLGRSSSVVELARTVWSFRDRAYPYPRGCKERTVYYWDGSAFVPVARYSSSLVKLIPTEWGAPTFEIDGIKMLPTAKVSPYADAEQKVRLIDPAGKQILDTCGGLGYFAAAALNAGAAAVLSFEVNPDVIWLRGLNPWSPDNRWTSSCERLKLVHADIGEQIEGMASDCVDAMLHDPPRFGIAGDLYSQRLYDQMARVIRRRGKLFHYTGTPNKLSSGRDVRGEIAVRLRRAGFTTSSRGDGILASKT